MGTCQKDTTPTQRSSDDKARAPEQSNKWALCLDDKLETKINTPNAHSHKQANKWLEEKG